MSAFLLQGRKRRMGCTAAPVLARAGLNSMLQLLHCWFIFHAVIGQ
ncbi:hypothetical protein [Burkholderia gladioli]|nr:hypothetical protein [Burkholderia gladioli]URV26244.1 hypothetical protein NAL90_07495 [Burkholderia gladioli]